MKKLFILASALLAISSASAQEVLGYSFCRHVSIYEPIADGTLVTDSIDGFNSSVWGLDSTYTSGSGKGFDLGFTINYNGEACTTFAISGKGGIQLGTDADINFQPNAFMPFNYGTENFIAAFAGGLSATRNTTVKYAVSGTEGNHVLTVEYDNVGILAGRWDDEPFATTDMQIKAYENGTFEFIYNDFAVINKNSTEISITFGMSGKNRTFMTRKGTSLTETTRSIGSQDVVTVPVTDIINGLTLSFIPPADCVAPLNQPTSFDLVSSSDEFSGTFVPASGADGTLVLYSLDKNPTALPENGKTYSKNDTIGNAIVLACGNSVNNIAKYSATPGTKYYITAYAFNSFCKGSYTYNLESPLTDSITTKPAGPVELEVKATGKTTATIKFKGNENGQNVLVAYSDVIHSDQYGNRAELGKFTQIYAAGDEIEGGGKVAYAGAAVDSVNIDGLNPSTPYYFMAYSYDDNGTYSTDSCFAMTATTIELPYEPDFNTLPRFQLPAGWSGDGFTDTQRNPKVGGNSEMQISGQSSRPDPETGNTLYVATQPVDVSGRGYTVTYKYTINYSESRFSTKPYNDWDEKDKLAIQVSDDGETWTDIAVQESNNHPEIQALTDFVTISGSLDDYLGKEVKVRIYWNTYFKAPFGATTIYIDSLGIKRVEAPTVPVVTAKALTYNTAKVEWSSAYTKFEVAVAEGDGEPAVSVVEAHELNLVDLKRLTDYTVKVRAFIGENEYTEWSIPATFTTPDYPECEAPGELSVDLSEYGSKLTAILSWKGNDEHLSWTLRYRTADATEYTLIEALTNPTHTLTNLPVNTAYLWSVKAACTLDRTTAWSAQNRFTTPATNSLSAATATDIQVTASSGCINVVNPGVMINTVDIYTLGGLKLASVRVDATDSIIVPVDALGTVIVNVNVVGKTLAYKVKL